MVFRRRKHTNHILVAGDNLHWWSQHNEHWIVLARMLFWIDLSWFHGLGSFLIVVNFLLIGIAYLVFSGLNLPKSLTINPKDSGTGRGEWPTNAIKKLIEENYG